jgi:L-iditol 2-dehydrogenase
LRARGITDVYMSELSKIRLEKAVQLGAKQVFDVSKVNLTEKIMEITGKGVNQIYECTGVAKSVNQGIEVMAKGGTLTLIGLFGEANIPVDLNGLIFREGSFRSNFRYRHIYPIAIKALAAGIVPLKDIVSHKFKLEELGQALKFNSENKDKVTKVVIEL